MEYLFLLYGDPAGEAALTAEQSRAIVAAHVAFADRARRADALRYGAPLAAAERTRTVRARSERHVVSDGPFAETKEQLGSIYVLECADDAEALAYAERIPQSPGLIVEIRPVAAV